jgi:hypothetical protein
VCTTAGPATQRFFSPRSLVARMTAATRRTIRPCGFSLETWEDMNSNTSPARPRSRGRTRSPWLPTITRSPFCTSDMGTVRARPSRTTIEQSISGFSTASQAPSTRTSVSRLVEE